MPTRNGVALVLIWLVGLAIVSSSRIASTACC
jgi:hypothetical protein